MSDWAGATNQTAFFDVFIATMAKLGRIEIKTAADGEIRRVCSEVN
jgi:peroxidase